MRVKSTLILSLLWVAGLTSVTLAQPAEFTDLGTIGPEGTYFFDNFQSQQFVTGTFYDTELALFDNQGNLLAQNDNANPSQWQFRSEIGATLVAGDYYLLSTEWRAFFFSDFFNGGDGFVTPGFTTLRVTDISTQPVNQQPSGYTLITQGTTSVGTDGGHVADAYFKITVVSPGPVEVFPTSFEVTAGSLVAGGIPELSASDNLDLSVRRSSSDVSSRVFLEVKGASPHLFPTSLTFDLEASVFARTSVTQTIELYDYDADDWEIVDTRNASRFVDQTVTLTPSGALARFVNSADRCIEARVRYVSPNNRQQFTANIDLIKWTIE